MFHLSPILMSCKEKVPKAFIYIYSHPVGDSHNEGLHQYLFQQGHLSKRTTWSRHAIPFTWSLVKLYPLSWQDQGYAYAWKRPAVISDLPRGLQKEGRVHGCPWLCSLDKTMAGKWLESFGCWHSSWEFIPCTNSKRKDSKKKNCIHIWSWKAKTVCSKP